MLLFLAVTDEKTSSNVRIVIDEKLFPQIAEGNRDSFVRLYELTKDLVYAYSLSILRNRDDAEDAMQDTYLKIRSAAHLYKPMGHPVAWIVTIARNVCLMQLREQRHTAWAPPDENSDLQAASAGTSCNVAPDSFGDAEDRLVLSKMLELLSEEDRQIVVLHAVSGMKHREIAQIMHLPVSTVLSKYRRSLQKLRTALEEP